MAVVPVWKEKFKVTHSLVAPDGLISIHGLAYCMQETAIKHADHAKFGYEDLIKKNIAWVLTRQTIKLYQVPRLNQKIIIETWADDLTNHIATRDFHILNKKDEVIAFARTSWMLIDLKIRKPVPVPIDFQNKIPLTPGKLIEPIELEKIPFLEEKPINQVTFSVVFSDLDMNHHVNNINYLKWVLDTFDYDFRMKYKISSVETNYLSEALYGEKLKRYTTSFNNRDYLTQITNSESERPILSARTKWLLKE
jgi:acyl-ACP thioesterase